VVENPAVIRGAPVQKVESAPSGRVVLHDITVMQSSGVQEKGPAAAPDGRIADDHAFGNISAAGEIHPGAVCGRVHQKAAVVQFSVPAYESASAIQIGRAGLHNAVAHQAAIQQHAAAALINFRGR